MKRDSLSQENFVVKSLPGLSDKDLESLGKMHAGLLPIGKDKEDLGSLFFWMFPARNTHKTPKLVFWLNGGPGCSSMDGLFLENGPFIPNKDKSITLRSSSWNQDATVVYVDQPVGTGYSQPSSHSGYARSLTQVAQGFRGFLEHWFQVFGAELGHAEVYIAGESYAGQFIPYIAKNLLQDTSFNKGHSFEINLKGILIGNGWIDPKSQYLSTLAYSLHHSLLSGDHLIGAKEATKRCEDAYKKSPPAIKSNDCEVIMNYVLDASTLSNGGGVCLNMYDIRLKDEDSSGGCGLYSWPPHLSEMKAYLGRADVKKAVHVIPADVHTGDSVWEECTDRVHNSLRGDIGEASVTLLPDLLRNINVLLFNGDMDLICNWFGLRDMVETMTWNGATGMNNAPIHKWTIDNTVEGWYQTARNLTFVLKYNASHMVPVDSPIASTDLFNRFIGATGSVAGSLVEDPGATNGYVSELKTEGKGHAAKPTKTVKPNTAVAFTSAAAVVPPPVPGNSDEVIPADTSISDFNLTDKEDPASFGIKLDPSEVDEEFPAMGDDELDDMLGLEAGSSSSYAPRKRN
ncbi:Cell death protease [Rhizoclosmatium sp. JEL0117]|nr:Cell death protease [Rhizoclosmatium sp. JEL0117]